MVVDDRVKNFEHEKKESWMSLVGQEENWIGKRCEELDQPCRSRDTDVDKVWSAVCESDDEGGVYGVELARSCRYNRVYCLNISSA